MQTTWGREEIIPLPCAPEARLYHGLAVLQCQHHDRIISNFLNLWIARSFFSLGQTDWASRKCCQACRGSQRGWTLLLRSFEMLRSARDELSECSWNKLGSGGKETDRLETWRLAARQILSMEAYTNGRCSDFGMWRVSVRCFTRPFGVVWCEAQWFAEV